MISLQNISMQYGGTLLFFGVTLNLSKGRRYGVVGANGSGKSTFLSLISGELQPVDGEVVIPKNQRIGWLKQDQFKYDDENVIDVVLRGKPELWKALNEKDILLNQEHWNEDSVNKLSLIEEEISRLNGYAAEAFAHQLLSGLGIREEQRERPLKELSGGYKLRVLLSQVLFNEPDILLLDEPTNYLDIVTIYWLERYLKLEFKGLLIFVSHDQDFLNHLSTHILDIDYGEISLYQGNFDQYIQAKKLTAEQKEKEKLHLERKIESMKAFIEKFKYKPSKARQAMSREKMLEKIELPDLKKSTRQSPFFKFVKKRESGKKVLHIDKLWKSYQHKIVLCDVSFTVYRGEKVAIIGPNGVGKSTLLKIIFGKIKPSEGNYEWGYEAQVTYFAQEHHDMLYESATLFDWLSSQCPEASSGEIRSMLGQVLFTQDDIYKDVLSLSGGEAARLLLAMQMLRKGNVLILDEPTNHLDIEARQSLEHSLRDYSGTLLFVSHDRYFISQIANRIIALSQDGLIDYQGTLKEYMEKYELDSLVQ
ncbi:MAG: ABC-F family ATPase [Chlamydiales bacterium]